MHYIYLYTYIYIHLLYSTFSLYIRSFSDYTINDRHAQLGTVEVRHRVGGMDELRHLEKNSAPLVTIESTGWECW